MKSIVATTFGRTYAIVFQVFDRQCKLNLIKFLALVTAVPLAVTGCTAERREEAPQQSSPTSETMQDAGEAPVPAANAVGLDFPRSSATTETAVLAVEAEGLRFFNPVTSAATPLPFGRPQSEVLATLERVRGLAGKGTNEDCGAGPVQYANWPDGLSLAFQRDRFVGWSLDGRTAGTITTAGGIGPGSTREALDGIYGDVEVGKTTLGDEFSAGSFFGLLDGPSEPLFAAALEKA